MASGGLQLVKSETAKPDSARGKVIVRPLRTVQPPARGKVQKRGAVERGNGSLSTVSEIGLTPYVREHQRALRLLRKLLISIFAYAVSRNRGINTYSSDMMPA